MVRAWWASGLSAPTLIAETTNRRTIERASSTSASGDGLPDAADPQLVARDGAVGGGTVDDRPVSSELAVDVADGDAIWPTDREQGDLPGDGRREQVRLAIGAESREPGIGQARLAPGRGLRDGERRRRAGGSAARRGRRRSSARATRRPSGNSAPRRRRRGPRRRGLEDSNGEHDELFEEALRICVEMKRARLFSPATTASHRLWPCRGDSDIMEREGLIGQADGSRPRRCWVVLTK